MVGHAIVAIPSRDDHIWKISSEKVPHLTLLFLGSTLKNQSRVADFIEHAVNTSLNRFWLSVDHRGVLGENSADVIFFDKNEAALLKDFRTYLLGNKDILEAYNSVQQFPSWIPHLTLGYPETPAKPDKRDYAGLHSVSFDRIALWTGNYEGVEFPLTTNHISDELLMAEEGKAFLEHYGVKGMKWGVRRDRAVGVAKAVSKKVAESYKPSRDAVDAQKYMARAKLGGVQNLSNREMQSVIRRMDLERQYKTLYGERQWHNAGKKWATNLLNDILKDAAASWLNNPFARRGGRDSPIRTDSWTTGQQFANVIEGSVTSPRAIGR